MKAYRIRHIPTGLFYQPAKGRRWQKNQLSKTGKTYTFRKPSPSLICGKPKDPNAKVLLHIKGGEIESFPLTEFEIVTYDFIESSAEPMYTNESI